MMAMVAASLSRLLPPFPSSSLPLTTTTTPSTSSSFSFSSLSSNRLQELAQDVPRNKQKKLHKGKSYMRFLVHSYHISSNSQDGEKKGTTKSRRFMLYLATKIGCVSSLAAWIQKGTATAATFADMPALRGKDYGKPKMRYPDYIETQSGLQYKDLRIGTGPSPKIGEIAVVDWDGYTIGYYGRIFEARNKAKGGSFEGNEKGYFKFKVGIQEVIPAFEEAVSTMAVGGVRRIIVPPELGYPDNDYSKKGPKPTTFSGQRALDFVLRNQGLIDKTLLFDIELLKVLPQQ